MSMLTFVKSLKRTIKGCANSRLFLAMNDALKTKLVHNYFNTNYQNTVLVSYITHPFSHKKANYAHTNNVEAYAIADVFRLLRYNVDVVDFNYGKAIDYSKYSVIFGFGDPLENSYYSPLTNSIIRIFYSTGKSVYSQNFSTMKRAKELYKRKGKWLLASTRALNKIWPAQIHLADAIIALGNDDTVESYTRYYENKVYRIPASYYKLFDYTKILEQKNLNEAKNHFLWFGGPGLIHKGLDILLDLFPTKPNIHLHICGNIQNEVEFERVYYKELYKTPNIHTYGFVDISSDAFKNILVKCCFAIFPSCSEGGTPSILNVMGNGGLIPIITKECSIDINGFGFIIKTIDIEYISALIDKVLKLNSSKLKELSIQSGKFTNSYHLITNYKKELSKCLLSILTI